MSSPTVSSLLYVCESSASELRELTDKLNTVTSHQAENVLRAIQKTGDVLSSALDRLSHFVDEIPSEEEANDDHIEIINIGAISRILDALEGGKVCPVCGGVRHD